MNIRFAILGLLRAKSMSGYDIKKEIQESPHLLWSGNNNQVYTALLALCREGAITGETIHQDNGPSKKVYQITENGRQLMMQTFQAAEVALPDYRNWFMLLWSQIDLLSNSEALLLLDTYRQAIQGQLLYEEERIRRKHNQAFETPKIKLIRNRLDTNALQFYRNELTWIQETQALWSQLGKEASE